MNRALFFFAGGDAFWWGLLPAGLLLIAAAEAHRLPSGARGVISVGLISCGLILLLSGPPAPRFFYSAGILMLFAVIALVRSSSFRWPWWRRGAAALMAAHMAILAGIDLPVYPESGSLAEARERPVFVIGDSLSAGIAAEARTWPEILAEDHGWKMRNLARAGARLEDAARLQAPLIDEPRAVVFLLIGGNDLVMRGSPEEFRRHLDDLILAVAGPDRFLVMVELPAIPGYRAFPARQRRAARQHSVVLIPRRALARIFMESGATVDGLHLSDRGHEAWAGFLSRLAGGNDSS